jgi:septal ring factor EnvC (AmiA/AmiB activator)
MSEAEEGLRERLTNRGEDALGKLAQDLLDNPVISGALSRAFEAREKAAAAQEVAMGALNIPSAADIERLTRRLRSVSQRIEGLEDGIDRIEHSLGRLGGEAIERRLVEIEEQLTALGRQLAELGERLPGGPAPIPVSQERLRVEEGPSSGPAGASLRRGPRSARTRSGHSAG